MVYDQTRIELDACFNQLEYLEIRNAILVTSILKATSLKHLCIEDANFGFQSNVQRSSSKGLSSVYQYGFNKLNSKLKHLSIRSANVLELDCFKFCSKNALFNEIEKLDLIINNPIILNYINKNFFNLQQLNIHFCEIQKFTEFLNHSKLAEVAVQLRSNLDVNLIGIPLKTSTIEFLKKFLNNFYQFIIFFSGGVTLVLLPAVTQFYKSISKSEQQLLDGFFKNVVNLIVMRNSFDEAIFKKLINVESVNFDSNVFAIDSPIFNRCMTKLEKAKFIQLSTDFSNGIQLDNRFLDKLSSYSDEVAFLSFATLAQIDFDFLFKLTELADLKMLLCYPIEQSIIINLIRKCKKLHRFNICFIRPANQDREILSSFKKMIYFILNEELRLKCVNESTFKIEIHRPNDNSQFNFLRLKYERFAKQDTFGLIKNQNTSDNNKMFNLIKKIENRN